MIPFEPREHLERMRYCGIPRLTETWEQALLFVGGVIRGGSLEISERRFEVRALRWRESSPSQPLTDRDQNPEEILEAAMAIAQQADRFVEAVIRTPADLDGHIVNYVSAHGAEVDLVECFDRDRNTCPIEFACGLKGALKRAQRAFLGVLDDHILADFLPRAPSLIRLLNQSLQARL